MFFSEENNSRALGAFIKKVESVHIEDNIRSKRLAISTDIIRYIYRSPEGWDERCTFNIKHIGEQFLTDLRNFDPSKLSEIDHIYCMAYRFLCEFDFLVGAGKELTFELRSIKSRIEQDNEEMDGEVRSQIIYASYFMPANIAKEFINDSNIGVFREFEEKKTEAGKLKAEWDKELEEKRVETQRLKEKLDEFKTAFNFVGLYHGFSDLAKQKAKESANLFRSLIFMGIVILTPLVIELIFSTSGLVKDRHIGVDHIFILIPLMSIEVILIYFFRVILINHMSVKAQKMQIELRQTLCQFIQSYADYSAKIKTQDSVALEKFESLIFSGIISNPEKLPSTFDGLDQIGELIKKVKNS